MQNSQSRVLVALDVPSREAALKLSHQLCSHVGGFKIGLELFCSCGPAIVAEIGAPQVFLDLKFHDIPNTVRGAARAAAKLGVMMFNVHCLGGRAMMQAAAEAAREVNEHIKVLGVTVLTSHDAAQLRELGLNESPEEAVLRLANLAQEAGLDGVVCSPHEITKVRAACDPNFLLVTPGIRPAGASLGDQKRVLTPQQAIDAGANYIVVGRPITEARDPVQAARELFK